MLTELFILGKILLNSSVSWWYILIFIGLDILSAMMIYYNNKIVRD